MRGFFSKTVLDSKKTKKEGRYNQRLVRRNNVHPLRRRRGKCFERRREFWKGGGGGGGGVGGKKKKSCFVSFKVDFLKSTEQTKTKPEGKRLLKTPRQRKRETLCHKTGIQ